MTYRDEKVGHFLLILLPCITILASAPLDIPHSTVDNHDHEEDRVKPGEWAPAQRVSRCIIMFSHTTEPT